MKTTILFLSANPIDTPRLRVDREIRDISDAVQRSRYRDNIVLKHQLAARTIDFHRALIDHNPDIIHFAGHGTGEQGIVVEDETGKPTLVNSKALTDLLKLFPKVKCILLNACYSENQATELSEYVDYVIGVSQEIPDEIAIQFAVGFYDGIGAGLPVQEAYKIGCVAIRMSDISQTLMPKLKSRNETMQLYIDTTDAKELGNEAKVIVGKIASINSELDRNLERLNLLEGELAEFRKIVKRIPLLTLANRVTVEQSNFNQTRDTRCRVTFVGDSGSGRSSLINALLGRHILPTGAGRRITGSAIEVYPAFTGDDEFVEVVYRSQGEFDDLLRLLCTKYQLRYLESFANVEELCLSEEDIPDEVKVYINELFLAWKHLVRTNRIGCIEKYLIQSTSNVIAPIIDEFNAANQSSSSRIIPGIAKIRYYLSTAITPSKYGNFANIIFVDTPGIGSEQLRHQMIVGNELQKANIVVLVLNSTRPSSQTFKSVNALRKGLQGTTSNGKDMWFTSDVLLVVNKMDHLSFEDLPRLKAAIEPIDRFVFFDLWSDISFRESKRRYFETSVVQDNLDNLPLLLKEIAAKR